MKSAKEGAKRIFFKIVIYKKKVKRKKNEPNRYFLSPGIPLSRKTLDFPSPFPLLLSISPRIQTVKALQLSAMRSHTLSLYPFFAGDLSGYPLFAFAPALQWQVGQEPFCSCARRPSVLLFPGSFKKYSSPHTPPPPPLPGLKKGRNR